MIYILDLECDNLLDKVTKIHCIVMKDINTDEVFTDINTCIEKIKTAKMLIGHNIIAFDMPVIKKILNIQTKAELFDTLVATRLIYAHVKEVDFKLMHNGFPKNLIGSQSLKAWGYRLKMHKGEKPQSWDTFTPEMLKYCEQDVHVTHTLYNKILSKEYSEESLKLEHDVQLLCTEMMGNGIGFDTNAAQKLYSSLSDEREKLGLELQKFFPPWIEESKFVPKRDNKKMGYKAGVTFIKKKEIQFNPNSRDHIAFRLKQNRNWKPKEFTPDGRAKVDDEILKELEWPEAKLLSRYFMIQKRIAQIAEGNNAWLKLERNNRLYGSINTNGAITGRATHSNPNLAQVPAVILEYGPECRSLFCASEGHVLVGADMSQIELRVLGHYMSAYDNGEYANDVINGDIHTRTLQALGLKQEERWLAKRFMYTWLYGGGGKKLGEVMGVTTEEGFKLKDKFLKKIPALKQLVTKVQEVSAKGDIGGLDGRRIFCRSQHSALNSLLQSGAAIASKHWIAECKQFLNEDCKLVAWIHDELILEVKKGKEDFIKKEVIKAIERAGVKSHLRVPLTGDSKIGHSWKEIH
ncbi:DNA polymerase [Pelagibacter phage HTVC200P]|nr:DNA polymerase [Pelagibacter phage HTVC200P]